MLFAVVCLFAFTTDALACACCAEAGTYSISTGKPGENDLAILSAMKFDRKAALYMDESGWEMIKGLQEVQKEDEAAENMWDGSFDLVNQFINKSWKFTITTPKGKTGTLALPMPTEMVRFAVDTHDWEAKGAGPVLYKEIRFKGYVGSGTGVFRSDIIKPTTYFLVFQGRGGNCDDVSEFTHWHLEINGKKADYAFNGKLLAVDSQQ
jgi:hypothetical protein